MEAVHFLVSGRWDNHVALVSLARALDPANHGSDRAIVSRIRTTPDIDRDGHPVPASGQPVSVAIPKSGTHAFVVNHSGTATPEEAAAFQHGHPGTITIVDLARAFDAEADRSLHAVAAIVPTGTTGPVGCVVTPDQRYLAVTSAEAAGLEDGGNRVTLFDIARREIFCQVDMPVRRAGAKPSPHAAPHETYGAFPDANGIAASPLQGGLLFTANGGTDDVSVLSLAAAREGRAAEIARIQVEAGPFGIAASPDGRLVAAASRESARTGVEGRTVSLIDAERAANGDAGAEIARIPVGSDDSAEATRPFAVAFTPDGRHLIVTAFRSNTISLIDVATAREIARIAPNAPGGSPARPRGVVVTPDGRHAAVVGGAKAGPGSSVLLILDLLRFAVAGMVTAVGNESYFLDVLPTPPDTRRDRR